MERVYAATASACLPALRSRSPSCLAPSADFSRSVSDGFTADFAGLVSLCVAGWFPLDPVAGFCRSVAGGLAGGRLPLGGPHMPHHRRTATIKPAAAGATLQRKWLAGIADFAGA